MEKIENTGRHFGATRILNFSIAMGANYSFHAKSIATFALTFLGTYIVLVLASVI